MNSQNDTTAIMSRFRNSSASIFHALCNDFEKKVKNISRRNDENVFQQLQGKYSQELKRQLTQLAKNTMAICHDTGSPGVLQKELTSHISYQVAEFELKARSM